MAGNWRRYLEVRVVGTSRTEYRVFISRTPVPFLTNPTWKGNLELRDFIFRIKGLMT